MMFNIFKLKNGYGYMLRKINEFRANLEDAYSHRMNNDKQSFEVKELTLAQRVGSLALGIVTLLGIIFSLGDKGWRNATKELFAQVLTGKIYFPIRPKSEETPPPASLSPTLPADSQPPSSIPEPIKHDTKTLADNGSRSDIKKTFPNQRHTTPTPSPILTPPAAPASTPSPSPSLKPTSSSSSSPEKSKSIVISKMTVRDCIFDWWDNKREDALKRAFKRYFNSQKSEIKTVEVEYKKSVQELSIIEFQQASGEYLKRNLKDIPPMLFAILTNSQIKALDLRECSDEQLKRLLCFDHESLLEERIEEIGQDKFDLLKTPRPAPKGYFGYKKEEYEERERDHCRWRIESLRWPVRAYADLARYDLNIAPTNLPVSPPIAQTSSLPPIKSVVIEVGKTVDLSHEEVLRLKLTSRIDSNGNPLPSPSKRPDLEGMEFLYHGCTPAGDVYRITRTK